MKEKETVGLDYEPKLPDGVKLIATKHARCGKGENPGYIILAMTGSNYVTWWMRESDSVCVQGHYFSMEEFKEAVEDFFSRQ